MTLQSRLLRLNRIWYGALLLLASVVGRADVVELCATTARARRLDGQTPPLAANRLLLLVFLLTRLS